MANSHGYVSLMRGAATDVDSFNRVGICSTDLDNGVFVTCGDIKKGSNGVVTAFNYIVATASDSTTGSVWLVDSPEIGTTIEAQLMSDPRYFYNEANRPVSLEYLNPKTDIIEMDANCFVGGTLPDGTTNKFATIGAGGKLTAATSAATGGKPYFSVVGFDEVAVGGGVMKTVLLQCESN